MMEDAEAIRQEVGITVEIIVSLLKFVADMDDREALERGSFEEQQDIPIREYLGHIGQILRDALTALQADVINVTQLRALDVDLNERTVAVSKSFEESSENFTPRPVSQATGHVFTGGLLAGLLDAVSAFNQLLRQLDNSI